MKTILILLASVLTCFGQTNKIAVVTTNLVKAVPWFREVKGQLYNVDLSSRFKSVEGNISEVFTNSVLIFWEIKEPVYGRRHSDSLVSSGNFLGGSGAPSEAPIIGYKTIESKNIIVLNYASPSLAVGQSAKMRAMQIGTTNFNGQTLELYDYGTPHVVQVVRTNYVSPAKLNPPVMGK